MKPFKALLLTSLVLGACEKSNDITQLHEEAVATAKYYGPRVEALAKREQDVEQRGRKVPGNLPDVPTLAKQLRETADKITEMKGIAGPADGGKSALETQADQLEKDGKLEELRKLVDESQDKLDESWTIANSDLNSLESWLWQYEQAHAPAAQPPVAPPQPTPNALGEPPPAAAGSPAEPPKAEVASPDNAAADKAAAAKTDNKVVAPKAGAGSAAAPKAAAPKAGAGSAAAPKAAAPKAAGSATK